MTQPDAPPESNSMNGRGTAWVIGQIILLAGIVVVPPNLVGPATLPDPLNVISLIIGLSIAIVGLLIVAAAALNLGSNLTVFPRPVDGGALVQSGLYSVVRHPIYCGVLLAALGWSIARVSIPSLTLTLVLGIFFDHKANREEQWLQRKFRDYAMYRERVRKLIPWLY